MRGDRGVHYLVIGCRVCTYLAQRFGWSVSSSNTWYCLLSFSYCGCVVVGILHQTSGVELPFISLLAIWISFVKCLFKSVCLFFFWGWLFYSQEFLIYCRWILCPVCVTDIPSVVFRIILITLKIEAYAFNCPIYEYFPLMVSSFYVPLKMSFAYPKVTKMFLPCKVVLPFICRSGFYSQVKLEPSPWMFTFSIKHFLPSCRPLHRIYLSII